MLLSSSVSFGAALRLSRFLTLLWWLLYVLADIFPYHYFHSMHWTFWRHVNVIQLKKYYSRKDEVFTSIVRPQETYDSKFHLISAYFFRISHVKGLTRSHSATLPMGPLSEQSHRNKPRKRVHCVPLKSHDFDFAWAMKAQLEVPLSLSAHFSSPFFSVFLAPVFFQADAYISRKLNTCVKCSKNIPATLKTEQTLTPFFIMIASERAKEASFPARAPQKP